MRFIPIIAALASLCVAACGIDLSSETDVPVETSAKFLRSSDPVKDEYIVVLATEVNGQSLETQDARELARELTDLYRGQTIQVYRHALRGFVAQMSEVDAKELAADPRVRYVEENGRVQLDAVQPNATWGLDRVDQHALPLDQTYIYNASGAGVSAYIIDTGIFLNHQDFGGRAYTGYDAVTPGGNANDCHGHGTHVAGTVGGATWGVAKEVDLYAVRVLDCYGSGTYAGVIAGVDWVTANHIAPSVANMSLGGGASQALDDAVTNSIAAGVVYAVAAGNETTDACTRSPARTPDAITVGATTITDARASFSNYGTCVDIFGPGSSITSAWHTSPTATNTISGTSMASPHVAGAAALYLSTNPAASPEQVANVLALNATPNVVGNPGTGSPNLLLYTGFIGDGDGDNIPPTAAITAPAEGDTVQGNVTISADASDDVGVIRVNFYANNAFVGMTTSAPYEVVWNTSMASNGSYILTARAYDAGGNVATSTPVTVTVVNPGRASYDPTLKVPVCAQISAFCDTGVLVEGRGSVGPESNAPNTIYNSCIDGNWGSFHYDESLDRIRIYTVDGSPMSPGATVKVDMTVWAWSSYSDYLDIYYTGDATNPAWTYLTTLRPPGTGARVLSATYVLPEGELQAVRGQFRYSGSASPCTSGGYNDRDDLVFAVGGVPSADFTFSCDGPDCAFTDASTDDMYEIVEWSWDFGDGATSSVQSPQHTYAVGGTYTVSLTVTNSLGLSNTIAQTLTAIKLAVQGRTYRSLRYMDLTWSGIPGVAVDVYRNGDFLTTVLNNGAYTDTFGMWDTSMSYQVCEAGTDTCSNTASSSL
jgi:subtilisin family serine protease